MSEKDARIDAIDRSIIDWLQRDAALSQRDLAAKVGLSQNACWRRVRRLQERGVLRGQSARVDAAALGLQLTVFMMIKTRHHARDWSDRFRRRVESIPEIAEFHRIGGDWDYLLKVVTTSMAGYDQVYQHLISDFDLETVTGFFSMETIFEGRPLALRQIATR
jgi:Lrp/AsnC family transcriptional regulator